MFAPKENKLGTTVTRRRGKTIILTSTLNTAELKNSDITVAINKKQIVKSEIFAKKKLPQKWSTRDQENMI